MTDTTEQAPSPEPTPGGRVVFASSAHKKFCDDEWHSDEFITAPYPTWTGIGVADLFPNHALVQLRVIARLPSAAKASK